MTIAPASFGRFAGSLLVGNFGDGKIGAYTDNGDFLGFLRDRNNDMISIDGLWALLPGTANTSGTNAIWFSAGPDDESHGLVGVTGPAGQPPLIPLPEHAARRRHDGSLRPSP
jgi:uncharacterized protein (TIGR03118 family)